jgi:hypothetical protein
MKKRGEKVAREAIMKDRNLLVEKLEIPVTPRVS